MIDMIDMIRMIRMLRVSCIMTDLLRITHLLRKALLCISIG